MQPYSENQIRALYTEFKSKKKYADKLAFFDRFFGIIPFPFPDFDPHLSFFFQKEKIEELADIFRKERNNPGLTEKKFFFSETLAFNIKPANSNSSIYSRFILSSFLLRKPVFEHWVRQKKIAEKPIEYLLDDANRIVNNIEYYLQNEYDKSFKLQCMSVFYKGLYDAFRKQVNLRGKKRKFIELYLYAQGIIYANYISFLKTVFRKSRIQVDLYRPEKLDLTGKLALLNELGIIDFLKKKYAGLDSESFEIKIAEWIRLITGERSDQKEQILLSMSNVQSISGADKILLPVNIE